jgi:hypothetical protein
MFPTCVELILGHSINNVINLRYGEIETRAIVANAFRISVNFIQDALKYCFSYISGK